MEGKVTVEQALSKGRWQLKYLPMIATFGCIGFGFFLSFKGICGGWIYPVCFILGFILGWLVWSYFVVKWKIWAYENVRNINELERKAVEEQLIWSSGSWFEKTEFKDYQQKQKLKQLEKKFLEKDIYKDDVSVPKETVIYYSRFTLIFLLFLYLGISVLGGYFLLEKEYIGLIFIVLGLYLTYDQFKKIKNKSPQIVINNQGIKLKNENLTTWDRIHHDRVYCQSIGKSATSRLAFNDEEISIDDLEITFSELEKLLQVYRVRYEKDNPA
ncbi:LapA family protein [Flavobacterium nackdongense]|uniref:LapA family protein n=1 Tax=Flavobacterium nackdongense TaxID=2547394 RepID=A0A4P6Y7H3_9FLAO|nr:LapA family protein [Flavobacterium nackdongense]QBN18536.1 LapA family protein [Flavobacterium nackdongense]